VARRWSLVISELKIALFLSVFSVTSVAFLNKMDWKNKSIGIQMIGGLKPTLRVLKLIDGK